MAKLNQRGKQYETPQITPDNSATEFFGGESPSAADIQRSANARGQKRHEMKRQSLADEEVLPESTEMVNNELVGVRDNGYLVKKELEFGVNAMYNSLPPGMDIEDQENCDIRKEDLVIYSGGIGYPGDGWTRKQAGRQKDTGRAGKTNYIGKRGT
jgi:hypothetical protein